MLPALFTLLKVTLLVWWLYLVGGAIRRRMPRKWREPAALDAVLTYALWSLAYACGAFLTLGALVFVNMYLGGPRWLDSLLVNLTLSSCAIIAIAGSICGLRAAHEERGTHNDG
jgi:hypothetical protein